MATGRFFLNRGPLIGALGITNDRLEEKKAETLSQHKKRKKRQGGRERYRHSNAARRKVNSQGPTRDGVRKT